MNFRGISRTQWLVGGVLFALLAAIVLHRAWLLMQSPYPLSKDGFYYLQEIRYATQFGESYYGRHNIFFFLVGHLAALLHIGEVPMFYLLFAGNVVAMSLLLYVLTAKSIGRTYALALPLIVVSSVLLFKQLYGSVVQVTAFSVLLAGVAVLVSRQRRWDLARLGIGLGFLLLAASMHIYVSVLALILTLVLPLRSHVLRGAMVVVLGAVVYAHFSSNPKAVFETLAVPELQAQGFLVEHWLIRIRSHDYTELLLSLIIVLWLAGLHVVFKRRDPPFWATVVLFLVTIAPLWLNLWNDEQSGGMLEFRIPQTAVLVLFLVIVFSCRAARLGPEISVHRHVLAIIAVAFFLQGFLFNTQKLERMGPRMQVATLEDRQDDLNRIIPDDVPILTVAGVQFRVTYFLGNLSARYFGQVPKVENILQLTQDGMPDCPPIQSIRSVQEIFDSCASLAEGWTLSRAVRPAPQP